MQTPSARLLLGMASWDSRTGRRRLMALVQLVLFVFTVSTPLLPCAHATHPGTPATVSTPASHDAMAHDAMAHDAAPATTSHEPPVPASHGTTCPWVIGCVGVAQPSLDSALRVAEQITPDAPPAGFVLRAISTDRDVELRPPRA